MKPLIIKLHVEFFQQVLACQNDEFWDFIFSRELVAVFQRGVLRGEGGVGEWRETSCRSYKT